MTMARKNEQLVFDVLAQCERTSSRNAKIKILQALPVNAATLLKEIIEYTYSPMKTFGITCAPPQFIDYAGPTTVRALTSELGWENFRLTVLTPLEYRIRTGNSAYSLVTSFLSSCRYPKWMQRVLNRDLRIGLGADTFLKLYPGLFPTMTAMLCDKYNGKRLPYAYYAQPKLDGLRCIIIVDEKRNCTALSRNNQPLYNLEHIFKELRKDKAHSYVLDGELFSKDWNESLSIAQTENLDGSCEGESAVRLKFYAFDIVPLEEWKAKKSKANLEVRRALLENLLMFKGFKYVHPVTYTYVATLKEEVENAMEMFCRQGYEGVVLKDPRATYQFKRSKAWLKYKPVYEDDFKVIKVEEGKGRNKGKLGALLVAGTIKFAGKKYKIITRVGTGFSDEQRLVFFKHPERVVGKVVQVKFQGIAERMKPLPTYALRFTVFTRLRTDK